MRSLTIIIAVFFPLLLFAGNGIWERRVNLLDVQTGYTYTIQEPVWVNQDTRLVSKLKGYLFLDYTRKEQSDLAVAAPANYWRMWVKYRVGVDPTVRELRISYENGNYVYSDYSEVTISNTGYDIIIDKVEGEYSSNGSSWTNVSNAASSPFIPNDIDLRLELRSETVYAMDPGIGATADMSRLNFNSTTFRVNWSFVEGAELYDLEWVFIDKYSQEYTALSTGLSSDYDLAFDKKAATRVRVWGTSYVLDKAYPEGTLYFRVRSVSNFTENGSSVDQIKLGNWSYFYDPSTVGATVELSELVRYEIGTVEEFEPNKNWLYGVAFAQEGKSVSSITYYDGSNRGRQGITYNTSDNVSLVGESKFDREGRQTLSIIPAPVSGRQLGYRTNFNLSSGGGTTVAFDEEDFDFSNPQTVVAAVSTTSGSGKYFSTGNDFSSDLYRAAIPDAQGYVYSQTIYRNDGSGRIERVGGIGTDFKASGDRAIRTYYGSATEAELKRLFGDNISDNPEGYRKELVRDANGQYSVTYYDKRGHVIATALSGDAPSNLRALDSIIVDTITTDLSDNNIVVGGTQIISEHTFLNTVPNNSITLNYDLTGAVNTLASQVILIEGHSFTVNTLCSSCHYDLELKILKIDGTLATPVITSSIDPGACVAGSYSYDSQPIVLTEPGEYRIIKTLSIDKDAMMSAFSDLLVSSGLTNSSDFVTSYLQGVDLSGCFDNCTDYCTAMWQLDYVQDHPGSTSTQAKSAWDAMTAVAQQLAIADCISGACNDGEFYSSVAGIDDENPSAPAQDFCYNQRQRLIQQISPGGYWYENSWGEFWSAVFGNNPSGSVTIAGQSYTLSQLQTPSVYTSAIAEALVSYHPEYCHLEWCAEWNNSMVYSMKLNNTMIQTGWSASNAVYQNPHDVVIDGSTDPFLLTFNTYFGGNTPYDGAYTSLPSSSRTLQYRVDNYLTLLQAAATPANSLSCGGTNLGTGSLSDYVMAMSQCIVNNLASQSPPVTLTPQQLNDMRISMYKGIYDNIKEQMIEEFKDVNGCSYRDGENAVFFGALDEDEIIDGALEGFSALFNTDDCAERSWTNVQNWLEQLPLNCLESLGLITINADETFTNNYTQAGVVSAYSTGGSAIDNLAEYLYAYGMQTCSTNTWGWFYDPGTGNPGKGYYDQVISTLSGTPCNYSNDIPFEVDPPQTLTSSEANQTFTDCFHHFIAMFNDGLDSLSQLVLPTNCVPDTFNLTITSSNYPYLVNDCNLIGTFKFVNRLCNGNYFQEFGIDNGSCLMKLDLNFAMSDAYIISIQNPVKYVSFTNYLGSTLSNVVVFDAVLSDGSVKQVYMMYAAQPSCLQNFIGDFTPLIISTIGEGIPPLPDYQADCIESELGQAEQDALSIYNQMLETLWNQFQSSSSTNCLNVTETLRMTYLLKEYQYTLYYYDLAGNLVQTVPPQGVAVLNAGQLSAMETDAPDNKVFPAHKMETRYEYNGLNSLIASYTPDGGRSDLYLDKLYRVRYSQNARQVAAGTASYSKYDPLGRVTEAGEFKIPAGDNLALKTDDANYPTSGIMDYTHTHYEEGYPSDATIAAVFGASGQENLRNAIGAVVHRQADYDANGAVISGTQTITVLSYSYDAHKNVKQLVSTNSRLADIGQQHKKVEYDYDLISGNVEEVVYQAGAADEYRHRYHYDANNRLIRAFTSKNNVQWEMDAKYFYYLHGSLARTETGHDKVQGSDYAYNLQGWLKGVNSATLVNSRDIGKDGSSGLNQWSGADVFGYQLGYYTGDYTAIGNGFSAFASTSELTVLNLNPDAGANNGGAMGSLYNGNITHMVTAIRDYNENVIDILGNNYQYDQLQRIRSMKANYTATLASSNNFSGAGLYRIDNGEGAYQESYEFDKNGNLKSLKRNGSGRNDSGGTVALAMDDFNYSYYTDLSSQSAANTTLNPSEINRLASVSDVSTTDANYQGDINSTQAVNNYQYDASGQLILDADEDIGLIEWTVTGKVKKITFTTEGKSLGKNDVKFMYDPMDMRVAKLEYVSDPDNPEAAAAELRYTYYTYDAGGNVMATYSRVISKTGQTASQRTYGDNFRLDEQMIYGSSRVGTENQKSGVYMVSATITQPIAQPEDIERALGYVWSGTGALTFENTKRVVSDKTYELSNHLGNVLAVVTDRKIKDPKASEPYNETFTYADGTSPSSLGWLTQAYSGYPTLPTLSIESGKLKVAIAGHGGAWRYFPTIPGETYTVTFDIENNAGAVINLHKWDFTAPNGVSSNYELLNTINSSGTMTYTFTATNAYVRLVYYTYSSNINFKIDNLKITNHKKYVADVVSYSDYSPYGTLLHHRHGTQTGSDSYRYAFQGQEKDDEIKGEGNSYNYTFRMHDPRIGRFFAVDPLAPKYPFYTPYAFSGNRLIDAHELEGLEPELTGSEKEGDKALAKFKEDGKVYNWTFKQDEQLSNKYNWVKGSEYTPTKEECAEISNHVYNTTTDGYERKGKHKQVPNTEYFIAQKFGGSGGYKAALYYRIIDGVCFYVMAYAGTDDPIDGFTDLKTELGMLDDQIPQAIRDARTVDNYVSGKNNGNNLFFTGHSLGGGLATAGAYTAERSAITFNAMGLGWSDIAKYGLNRHSEPKIDAYIISGEAVDAYQLSFANGKRHYVSSTTISIMSVDVWLGFHPEESVGMFDHIYNPAYEVYVTAQRVKLHSLDRFLEIYRK